MTVLAWGVLEAGLLTGKFLKNVNDPTRIDQKKLKVSEKNQAVVKEVEKIAQEVGRPMSQVAINWVRQNPNARMIPILGARSEKQLKDNLGAMQWALSEEQYKRLDEASAIDLGFPHSIIKGNEYVFGATFDKIDNHRV